LGLQIAVIEFARNVLGQSKATSQEFEANGDHAVVFMPEISRTHMGGTMRLGSRPTIFHEFDSSIARLYKVTAAKPTINERHRHRYEVNPELVSAIEAKGLKFIGRDDSNKRMEVFTLDKHPYYVGTQYHPEFKSRPTRSSAPFLGLVLASASPATLATYIQELAVTNLSASSEWHQSP